MDEIMKISFVFDHEEEGVIIVGINPEMDSLTHPEIASMIGEKILIKCDDIKVVYKVRSIHISTSLANKKNIGIAIGKDVKVKDIQIGSVVYTVK